MLWWEEKEDVENQKRFLVPGGALLLVRFRASFFFSFLVSVFKTKLIVTILTRSTSSDIVGFCPFLLKEGKRLYGMELLWMRLLGTGVLVDRRKAKPPCLCFGGRRDREREVRNRSLTARNDTITMVFSFLGIIGHAT